MNYLVIGISYKTAGMDLLGRVALTSDAADKLARLALACPHVREAAVLASCNRTEVYAVTDRFHSAVDEITSALADVTGVIRPDLADHLYVTFADAAAARLFAVAASLDSMVPGESQILGQVRTTLRHAQELQTAGPHLNALFQHAISAAKRVHATTGIDRAARSVVSAGLDLLERGRDPRGQRVLVAGAGSMAGLAVQTLAERGARGITVANRRAEPAERLALRTGGRAADLAELPALLATHDLVVCCTSSSEPVIGVDELRRHGALDDRDGLQILDVALPPDVDPDARELPGLTLVGLAELADPDGTVGDPPGLAAAREQVDAAVEEFLASRRAVDIAPTVVALRAMADDVVSAELARVRRRLTAHAGLPDETVEVIVAEIAQALHRTVDKVLHAPTVRVKQLADDAVAGDYPAALRALFDLDPSAAESISARRGRTTAVDRHGVGGS